MFNPQRITELIENHKLTKKEFWKGSEIGCMKLERIADFFNVSMDYFYDREKTKSHNIGHNVTGNHNTIQGGISINEYEKEIAYLKELLQEKERTIQILMNK